MRADQVRVSQESRGTLPQTSVHDADKARKRCPATPFWKRLGMHQVASVAMVTMFVLPVAAFAQRSTNLALVDPETTPIPVAPISVVEYMVVGVTSTTTSGRIRFGDAQGVAAGDAMCQQEFGASARMATVSDRLLVDAIPLPASAAWTNVADYAIVEPSASRFIAYATANASVRSISGPYSRAVAGITCAGFAAGGDDTGAITRGDGQRGIMFCSSVVPVACARPVAVQVMQP